jgi:class 3 adenylate cyclase/tetratricopeptide (TPR) repeat protein
MQCLRCQAENREGARFCRDCGATFGTVCSTCGVKVEVGSKFCDGCGEPLAATPAPSSAGPSRFSSPETYTPKHLAERILSSKAALEGERKQVTVLFADLKGSMELLADRDPEEASKILDPVLEHMMEAVHRYEGTVNQVMGDGIMALFGAPLAHEDHAVRACYAALSMQDAIKRYAEDVRRTRGVAVQIRVGLNSGEVVVRSVGSDLRMDYTAVGQTTHLAARMEQAALPGSIVISPETLRLAEGYVEVKPLGPVPVKGLKEPVEIYEVTNAGSARTRIQAAVARGLTRFVGRDSEFEHLRESLALTADGRGQVVAVMGEAGVGKSRLFYELTHSHRVQGWLVLESGSVSYGKATNYLPVVDLLQAYFKIQSRDHHREIREKVTGKLLTLDETLKPTLPALLSLLDVPIDDAQWQGFDPPQRRARTLDAVKRLLLRESQVQPVLLVFEDLHWIDVETQALLDGLIESLPSSKMLLLVNYRPGYQHAWTSKTCYSQLRLDTLPPESTTELLGALLGTDPGLEPLKQLLLRRGNPFFLEETVRALIETKALVGERGAYRLTQAVQSLQVPPTVQIILAARIDRLAVEDKQLLQAAAVVGKDVPYAVLSAIAGLPEEALRRGLAHLQAGEFLDETRLFPDLEYSFKHALTHEVTYGGLLQERRRMLHAQVVAAIEARYPDRLAEQVERLAHHALRGEVWDKATTYARQAGDRAAALCVDTEAVAHYQTAMDALTQVPVTPESVRAAIDVRLALRAPLWRGGQLERLLEIFRETEALGTKHNETERLDTVYSFFLQYYWAKGDYEQGIVYGERCLETGARRQDIGLEVTGHYYLGGCYQAQGRFALAIEHFQTIVDALEGPREIERFGLSGLPYSGACALAAQCLVDIGDAARARDLVGRGERAVNAANHLYSRVPLAIARGHLLLHQGRPAEIIATLEPAVAICRENRFVGQTMIALTLLGHGYALAGRAPEAVPLLQEAIALQEKAAAFVNRAWWVRILGEAYRRAGQLDEAETTARSALEFARRHGERGNEAWIHALRGDIAADRGDVDRARVHFEDSHQLASALGMRPLVAHGHVSRGMLDRRTGRTDDAREHFRSAATLFREMQMRGWLEQLDTEAG